MAAYLNPPETASIEAGAHIDPEGHNLYNPALDSLQLVSVPVNTSETLERLNEALNSRQYSGRALEHCRKLLTLFLAGKQNGIFAYLFQHLLSNDLKHSVQSPANLFDI